MFECDICKKRLNSLRGLSCHRTKIHNPVINARIRKNQKAAQSKPETRARHSKAQKRVANDPEYQKKRVAVYHENFKKSDLSKRMSEYTTKRWSDPEKRKEQSEKLKKVYQDKELRERISKKVSKIVQSDDFRLERSIRSKEMWKNPGFREKVSIAISKSVKKSWEDSECRKNHTKGFNDFLDNMTDEQFETYMKHNTYGIRSKTTNKSGKSIRCDSSYELRFCNLMNDDESVEDFDRFRGFIPIPGSTHRYNPDFLVKLMDGREYVIEIKSSWTLKNGSVADKAKAGISWCRENDAVYRIVTETGLDRFEDTGRFDSMLNASVRSLCKGVSR